MTIINRTLMINLTIKTNGTPEVDIDHLLHQIPHHAAGEGMFTGETEAETTNWSAELVRLPDGEDDDEEQVADIYLVTGYSWECPNPDCQEVNDIDKDPNVDSVTCDHCKQTFKADYIG